MSALLYRIGSMRVRRGYRGGALLDLRAGRPAIDGQRPEDWIASAVPAVNPGLPPEPGEGLTPLIAPDGTTTTLAEALRVDPVRLLGAAHAAARGPDLGFLAKLLDSAMRLHAQAHPTREFARSRLGAPYGKLEAYVILAVRPGAEGWIRLGFQRSPGRDGWRRIVAEQDTPGMDACFAQIPVKPGETWLVPGGWPHAIGPGVLMLEVMEPSDLVVRCEFERAGIVVPPAGRFMGRDLEFCLDVFDYAERSADQVRERCRLADSPTMLASGSHESLLIGTQHTDCFTVRRVQLAAGATTPIARDGRIALCLAEHGRVTLESDDARLDLAELDAALVPAASGALRASAVAPADLLIIQPGADDGPDPGR